MSTFKKIMKIQTSLELQTCAKKKYPSPGSGEPLTTASFVAGTRSGRFGT